METTTTTLAYGVIFVRGNDYLNFLESVAEKLTPYQQKRLCAGWDVWEDEAYEDLADHDKKRLDEVDLSEMDWHLERIGNYTTYALMSGYLRRNYPTLYLAMPGGGVPLVVFNESSRRIMDGANGVLDTKTEDATELERFLSDHNTEAEHQVIFWTKTETDYGYDD